MGISYKPLAPQGSECTFYNGIGRKDANVLDMGNFYKNFRFCKITVVDCTLKVLLGITEMFDGTRNHLSIKHYPVALNKCTFLNLSYVQAKGGGGREQKTGNFLKKLL